MKQIVSFAFLVCGFASVAMATSVNYTVAVNTASLSGTTGSLDFQFNPGPTTSQSATAQVLNFVSAGDTSGGPSFTGDATGALPGRLTLINDTPYNDYFQDFTFGASLSFEISLTGPALTSADDADTSGSTFVFSIFSDSLGTLPALTTDTTDGFGYVVNLKPDGSTSATDYLIDPAPEPGTLLLVGIAFAIAGFIYSRSHRLT